MAITASEARKSLLPLIEQVNDERRLELHGRYLTPIRSMTKTSVWPDSR